MEFLSSTVEQAILRYKRLKDRIVEIWGELTPYKNKNSDIRLSDCVWGLLVHSYHLYIEVHKRKVPLWVWALLI